MGAPDGPLSRVFSGDVLDEAARLLEELACDAPSSPFSFIGGLVGWITYEGSAELMLADRLLAFDHEAGEAHLICLTEPGAGHSAEDWFARTSAALAAAPSRPRHQGL